VRTELLSSAIARAILARASELKKNTGIQTGNDWNIDSRNLYQKPDKFSEV
jgi:hypothetical protein